MTRDYARKRGAKKAAIKSVWFDPATGVTVGVTSLTKVGDCEYSGRHRPPQMSYIPFRKSPSPAVATDGALIIEGRVPEVREYDLDGRLRRIFRIDGAGRPVREEDIQAHLELTVEPDHRDQAARRYDARPIPDTLPSFQSLQIDASGWLWVEVFQWDPLIPKERVVFDPEGRAHGTIRTPPGLPVQGIGADFILEV